MGWGVEEEGTFWGVEGSVSGERAEDGGISSARGHGSQMGLKRLVGKFSRSSAHIPEIPTVQVELQHKVSRPTPPIENAGGKYRMWNTDSKASNLILDDELHDGSLVNDDRTGSVIEAIVCGGGLDCDLIDRDLTIVHAHQKRYIVWIRLVRHPIHIITFLATPRILRCGQVDTQICWWWDERMNRLESIGDETVFRTLGETGQGGREGRVGWDGGVNRGIDFCAAVVIVGEDGKGGRNGWGSDEAAGRSSTAGASGSVVSSTAWSAWSAWSSWSSWPSWPSSISTSGGSTSWPTWAAERRILVINYLGDLSSTPAPKTGGKRGDYVGELSTFLEFFFGLCFDDTSVPLSSMHLNVIRIIRLDPRSSINLHDGQIMSFDRDAGKGIDGGTNESEQVSLVGFKIDGCVGAFVVTGVGVVELLEDGLVAGCVIVPIDQADLTSQIHFRDGGGKRGEWHTFAAPTNCPFWACATRASSSR
jgi:hypothetical protein